MNSIFLSYSYNDLSARYIVEALRESLSEGETILYSNETLFEYGVNVRQHIIEAINKCSYVICIFENANSNIMFELGYALGKNKNIILIGEYNDIPDNLKDLNYVRRSDNINEILIELNKRIYTTNNNNESENICYSEYMYNIERVIRDQDFLDKLSYYDFEKIIYEYLNAQGLSIEYPLQNKDRGYDFLISRENCLVEVKKYSKNNKISLTVIRTMLGTMVEMNVDKCIIISSSEFTQSAINFVQNIKQEIVLLTLHDLIELDGKFTSVFSR